MISDADHEPLAVDHDADHEPLDECRRMVGVGVGVGEVGGDEPGDFVRFELPEFIESAGQEGAGVGVGEVGLSDVDVFGGADWVFSEGVVKFEVAQVVVVQVDPTKIDGDLI